VRTFKSERFLSEEVLTMKTLHIKGRSGERLGVSCDVPAQQWYFYVLNEKHEQVESAREITREQIIEFLDKWADLTDPYTKAVHTAVHMDIDPEMVSVH
jgi:hypothetical protein